MQPVQNAVSQSVEWFSYPWDFFLKLLPPKFIKLEHKMFLHFNAKGWHRPENLCTYWFYEFPFFVRQPTVQCACLSVCYIPKTSKWLNRLGPIFLWDLTWSKESFMNGKNFKKFALTNLIFQNPRKKLNFRIFLLFFII